MLRQFVMWLCSALQKTPDQIMMALIILGSIVLFEFGRTIIKIIFKLFLFLKSVIKK